MFQNQSKNLISPKKYNNYPNAIKHKLHLNLELLNN